MQIRKALSEPSGNLAAGIRRVKGPKSLGIRPGQLADSRARRRHSGKCPIPARSGASEIEPFPALSWTAACGGRGGGTGSSSCQPMSPSRRLRNIGCKQRLPNAANGRIGIENRVAAPIAGKSTKLPVGSRTVSRTCFGPTFFPTSTSKFVTAGVQQMLIRGRVASGPRDPAPRRVKVPCSNDSSRMFCTRSDHSPQPGDRHNCHSDASARHWCQLRYFRPV